MCFVYFVVVRETQIWELVADLANDWIGLIDFVQSLATSATAEIELGLVVKSVGKA